MRYDDPEDDVPTTAAGKFAFLGLALLAGLIFWIFVVSTLVLLAEANA